MKFAKHIIVLSVGLLALVYLSNPTAGIIELIPDNFPLVGNLDEVGATALLLACLAYYGIDVTSLMKSKKQTEKC